MLRSLGRGDVGLRGATCANPPPPYLLDLWKIRRRSPSVTSLRRVCQA